MTLAAVGWPREPSPGLAGEVRRVLEAVVALRGAVGWPAGPPDEVESAAWLDARLSDAATGRARFAVARVDGRVQAMGRWEWMTPPVRRFGAWVYQVMTHPDMRGQGLARTLMTSLIDDARAHGVEHLVLEVRGNNHRAEAFYRSLGFAEVGVYADAVAVGRERFDLVAYQLVLGLPADVVSHGRERVGPGAS
jgi:ribosomal protein S18 acetylase RimI-like enzyme